MENYQFSSDHPYPVDAMGLEQVEVIKGPASLLYGSDAIGGVINLVEESPPPPGTLEGEARLAYHSNTSGIESRLGVRGGHGNFIWGLRGGLSSHMDYRDGNGDEVPNSRYNNAGFKAFTGLRSRVSMHRLKYEYQQWKPGMASLVAESGIPEHRRKNDIGYQDLDNHMLMLRNHFFLESFKLQANLSYQYNHRKLIILDPGDPAVDMKLNTLTCELRGNLVTSDISEFTLAIQGLAQGNENQGAPNRVLPDYRMKDFAVFGLVQHDFPGHIHLQVGLRFDNRFLDVPEQEKSAHSHEEEHEEEPEEEPGHEEEMMPALNRYYGNVSGSLGVTYEPGEGILFRANLASAYRAPNIAELTQDGEHGLRYEQGNRDLLSQRNYELDASVHFHRDKFMVDLAGFYNHISNYIYLGYTADTTDEGLSIYRYLQNNARLYGFEVVLEVLPVNRLSLKAGYNHTRGQQLSGENLPFIPQDRFRSELRWNTGKLPNKTSLYIKLGSELALARENPSEFEMASDTYHLLHAGAGLKFPLRGRSSSIDLTISNLLNTRYIDHLSVLREWGYYNMGRNITLSLHLGLGA